MAYKENTTIETDKERVTYTGTDNGKSQSVQVTREEKSSGWGTAAKVVAGAAILGTVATILSSDNKSDNS